MFLLSVWTCVNFRDMLCLFVLSVAGEACWWTIHPASKQRSEGEKVRVGDDLILVSVSSERYLVIIFAILLNNALLLPPPAGNVFGPVCLSACLFATKLKKLVPKVIVR